MSQLRRTLEVYESGEDGPERREPALMKAAREASQREEQIVEVIRGSSIRSVATLAVDLDRMADMLRRAAQNLRNVAASELRHPEPVRKQTAEPVSSKNARTTETRNPNV